ncbi:MAG: tRNA lysidine(34) synthetase TilS [Burkholderiaceae bacterium]
MASSKKPARDAAVLGALKVPPTALKPGLIVVGYSGGLDSTVLLHGLTRQIAEAPAWRGYSLLAVHINHRLQPAAMRMERHCRLQCRSIALPLMVRRPTISAGQKADLGIEAAARQARRLCLRRIAQQKKARAIALAHHQDDLVETMLLQWMRGAGLEGLTAMQAVSPHADVLLWRPLLGCDKASLEAYARAHRLSWIEDPSNALPDFDRNRLRQEVLPVLRQIRTGALAAMARSIGLLQDARGLLESFTAEDLKACLTETNGTLRLQPLRALGRQRMARVLRAWIASHGQPMPPSRRLDEFGRQLETAGPESRAQITVAPAVAGESGGFRVWLRAGFLHLDRL